MRREKKRQTNQDIEDIIITIYNKLYESTNLLTNKDEWSIKDGKIEWPGNSSWEIMIGAILIQRSSWRNTAKALENLRKNELTTPEKILSIDIEQLSNIIRSAGFPARKAKTIIELAKLIKKYSSMDNIFKTQNIRNLLLNIYGIGNETADVIMLYAGQIPTIPISDYTKRILSRVLGINKKLSYKEWQTLLLKSLHTLSNYKNFHALTSELGYHYCHPKPLCTKCPLSSMCNYAFQHKKIYA
ncbi:MAG: endonuclease [Thermoprotei archaeon]